MKYTQIRKKQLLKSDINTVWNFISSPKNLAKITPKYMNFKITSIEDDNMRPGMIISYKVSPILSIPLSWVTEITHVNHLNSFVDEQRFGPYKMWHHEHIITKTNQGIIMEDIVTYVPPFGVFGKMLNILFIKKQVKSIFEYRYKIMEKIFNKN